MKTSNLFFALLTSAALAACSSTGLRSAGPATLAEGILVGSNGMSLYTFDKDVAGSGKSVCNGPCAGNWPPLLAEAGAMASGDYSVIVRDDGRQQWAFRGKPLYYWVKDQKPGERSGDGFNNVWRVVRP